MPAKEHFRTLDFLRGTAALCVLLMHWCDGVGLAWFRNAALAVDFFFLLSGFVIAYSYESRLLSASISSRRFLWLRFVRLYPMILAATLLGLFRHVFHNHFVHSDATWLNYLEATAFGLLMIPVLHMTPLTPGYGGQQPVAVGSPYPLDQALWSLFYEGVANIFYGLFVKTLTTSRLLVIVIAGWFGLAASHLPQLQSNRISVIFALSAFRVVFSFFMGVVIFRFRSANRLPGFAAGPLVLSAILVAIAMTPVQSAFFDAFAITLIFPLVLIMGANDNASHFTQFSRLLGDLSYPVYVLQIPMMWTLTGALKSLHLYERVPRVPLGVLVTAMICACSWLALKFYDEPVRRWLTRDSRKLDARKAHAAAG